MYRVYASPESSWLSPWLRKISSAASTALATVWSELSSTMAPSATINDTLTELQTLYESILETEFDVRNFRKKILSMDFITDTGLKQTSVTHRPAKLFKYNAKKYNNLINTGFAFDL